MALAFRRPRISPEIRRLFALILPGAIGASAAQISALVDVFFASLLPPGAVSYLYYADRLNQLPLGVIGVAVGTALLPLLARQLRAGERGRRSRSQNRAIELALLLTLPAALALSCWPGRSSTCCSSTAPSAPRTRARPAGRSPPTPPACRPTC